MRGVARWLAQVAPARASGTVNLTLIGDLRMRRLNRRFRGVDRFTDVLSFPVDGPSRSGGSGRPGELRGSDGSERFLGDIAIARGVARRQAHVRGHSVRTELRVLALHGLLHLLGYDHERDDGLMERLERRLRRQGGLREGLIEREP